MIRRSWCLLFLAVLGLGVAVAIPEMPTAEAQSKKKKKKDKDDEEDTEEEQDLEGETAEGSLIALIPVARRNAQRAWEIEVSGTARLPDDAEIKLTLRYAFPENDPIDTKTHIVVKGGRFGNQEKVVFGPFPSNAVPHGNYWVVGRYLYDEQTAQVQENFRKYWTDPEKWKGYVDFSDRKFVYIGTKAQEANEDEKRREHYAKTSELILEMMDEFDEALVSAMRIGFDDRSEWEKYVEERGLLREEGEDLEKKLDKLRKNNDYVNGDKLDVDAWRKFIDRAEGEEIATHPVNSGGLRGRIARVLHDHREFTQSKLGGKLPKADDRIERMGAGLYDLTLKWSRNLYRRANIQVDPVDTSARDPVRIREKGSHKRVLSLAAAVEQEIKVFLPKS